MAASIEWSLMSIRYRFNNPGMLMAHSSICDPSNDQIKHLMPPFILFLFVDLFSVVQWCDVMFHLFFSKKQKTTTEDWLAPDYLVGILVRYLFRLFRFYFFSFVLINSCWNGDIKLIALIACVLSLQRRSVQHTESDRHIKTYWVLDFYSSKYFVMKMIMHHLASF